MSSTPNPSFGDILQQKIMENALAGMFNGQQPTSHSNSDRGRNGWSHDFRERQDHYRGYRGRNGDSERRPNPLVDSMNELKQNVQAMQQMLMQPAQAAPAQVGGTTPQGGGGGSW